MGIAGMLSNEDCVIVCVEIGRNIQLMLARGGFCPAGRSMFLLQPTETVVSARWQSQQAYTASGNGSDATTYLPVYSLAAMLP
jgi:hypothetical protein